MKDSYQISWRILVYLLQRCELNKPGLGSLTLSSTGTDGDGANSILGLLLGYKSLGDKISREYLKKKKKRKKLESISKEKNSSILE